MFKVRNQLWFLAGGLIEIMSHSCGTLWSASTLACRHTRSNVATQIESWAISLLRTTTTSTFFSSRGMCFSLLVTGYDTLFKCLLESWRRALVSFLIKTNKKNPKNSLLNISNDNIWHLCKLHNVMMCYWLLTET